MSVYRPKSVEEEPDAVLSGWTVFEVKLKGLEAATRHFSGFNHVTGDGRVSSPIMAWNPETRTGVTRSGRRYRLVDELPTIQGLIDAEWCWEAWCRHNGIEDPEIETIDVSKEYRQAFEEPADPGLTTAKAGEILPYPNSGGTK